MKTNEFICVYVFLFYDKSVYICEKINRMRVVSAKELKSAKRLVCFDLDGTLSQHKSHMPQANKDLLKKLDSKYKLIMVGAGNAPRIYNQMEQFPIDIIGNYGMQESAIVDGEFKIIREDTSHPDKEYFNKTCQYIREKYGYTEYTGGHLEFHASGMVTFCLIGSGAKVEDKVVFDPDRSKRRVMYDEICSLFPEHVVYIGGSSSFDFAPKQYNKYDSIMKYAAEHGYKEEEILFVGDDFGDGGGDSHVRIKGMDYVQIEDYTKLPEMLDFLL